MTINLIKKKLFEKTDLIKLRSENLTGRPDGRTAGRRECRTAPQREGVTRRPAREEV
ncbi:hypothetical protein C7427_105228 [Pantoea ananatis]|nr:hypothetical protein C7427_105228 [Pantoea ananatis]